jgi:hypothetical protein
VYTSSPSIVISASIGAAGDHSLNLFANFLSHPMMVEYDLPNDLPAALSPIPSVRTFMAIVTSSTGVLSLAITVPVRSLNCLPQPPHRYFWIWLPPFNLVLPFLSTCSLWHFGHFISDYS